MFIFILIIAMISFANADPASDQLPHFRNGTSGPIGILTTSHGSPIEAMDIEALNSNLLTNDLFMDSMPHLVRERIPDRFVHAKGAGAFGYFEATHSATDFCKAKLFGEIGKRTPVGVRFSLATKDKGEPDTIRDLKGFGIKFYTEEGNFDIVGLSSPMFFIKDPNFFSSMVHAIQRNPQTSLKDPKAFWDLVALRPEMLFFFLYVFTDYGTPDGYRYMSGFSIHTYQVYNECGDSYFVRFHVVPEQGNRNLHSDQAAKIAAADPDYAIRDLFDAIALGNFPTWNVSVQVLSPEDVRKCDFDPFDTTKVLPLNKYPLRPLGKLVLNENPINSFAQIEQLALCPGHLVPGILGGPDNLFQSRRFSYKDAQLYRLGVNFNKIRVNCPFKSTFSYNRDGRAPVGFNGGDAPNYLPNSYNGPIPYVDNKRPKLISIKQDTSLNFDQAADFYKRLTKGERSRMIDNMAASLNLADLFVQRKVIRLLEMINYELARKVAKKLSGNTT